MASYIVGCDLNRVSEDKKTIDAVAKALKAKGHSVEKLSVGPNYVQSAMLKSSSKGKIAVMCCNGADLQTYKDFWQGITKGYYHVKYAIFGLEGWISPSTCSCQGAKTAKLKKAHDDASSVSYTKELVGMTTAQVCEKYKEAIAYCCGNSREELAKNIAEANYGGGSSNSSSSTPSTIKEALKEVLSGWDGDVECFMREGTVYVRKIKEPQSASLSLIESQNVFYDSVSVTDCNPSTVNRLIVKWKKKSLVLKDDNLIRRFGLISKSVTADSKLTKEEVYAFAEREFAKLQRDNGHTLECKTLGSHKWKVGQWCRVYLPSFNIDGYMYITKVSQEDSGSGWLCNLTLTDYPPSLGKPKEKENNKSDGG